jgi:hypothetical protein
MNGKGAVIAGATLDYCKLYANHIKETVIQAKIYIETKQ